MKSLVYSRWDGSQGEFSLDAERALDALSDLMMEGMTAAEALEWMRQFGFHRDCPISHLGGVHHPGFEIPNL